MKLKFLNLFVPSAFLAAVALLAGCSTQQFYTNYYVDPKPVRVTFADLTPVANPSPVYLVFDMYMPGGSFPEATRQLAPKIVRVINNSGLFSRVSTVGSENIARIQVSMRVMAVLSGNDLKSLPAGLTSGLAGSRGAIVYQFTAQYQLPGKEVVKKVYPHAVHLVDGNNAIMGDELPMSAPHAVNEMVERVMLTFLRDLQKEGKLH